jgi:hypothetical protein
MKDGALPIVACTNIDPILDQQTESCKVSFRSAPAHFDGKVLTAFWQQHCPCASQKRSYLLVAVDDGVCQWLIAQEVPAAIHVNSFVDQVFDDVCVSFAASQMKQAPVVSIADVDCEPVSLFDKAYHLCQIAA